MTEGDTKQNAQGPRKRFSLLKKALIIGALILALLALRVVLILTAKPTISVNYVAELNRITKPADYDPNKNAALDYQKAIDTYTRAPQRILHDPFEWAGNMNKTDLGLLSEWIAANAQALSHLRCASDKPYLWTKGSASDNDLQYYEPGIDLAMVRKLLYLLTWHAKLEAHHGRSDAALEDMITGYKLTSHFAASRVTLYQVGAAAFKALMVKQTFLILANDHLDSQALKGFQQQLEVVISQSPRGPNLESAKLFLLDTIQRTFTDNGRGNGRLIPTRRIRELVRMQLMHRPEYSQQPIPRFLKEFYDFFDELEPSPWTVWTRTVRVALLGPDRKDTMQAAEEYFQYIENLKDQTPQQQRRRGIDPEKQIQEMQNNCLPLQSLGPLRSIVAFHQRSRTEESALLAGIAILRYKADKGELPPSLEQLVSAGYLKELPMDPYSDKPLVYKLLGDDFTLYSLGADFDDDSGTPSRWGMRPQGGDMVFWPVKRPGEKQK